MIKERQAQLDALYHRLASPDPVLQTQMHESTMAHSLEDKELVEKASTAKSGAYFRALYFEGDLSRYGGDHSRADLALMGMLAFWSGKDAEQMERLFTESALGQRDKWRDRLDYRERTIRKAIEGCYDTYKGRPQANLEVQQKIRRLEEVAAGLPWDGRNGARNRYVLDAVLYTGCVWGVPHPEGVIVGTSIRHLALVAGIGSVDSVQAAIRELDEWVEVVKRGRDATTPNTYLIKDRANPVQSLTHKPVKTTVPALRALLRRVRENGTYQPGGEKRVRRRDGNRIVSHVIWMEDRFPVVSGSVGKKAALVLEKVVLAGGRATLRELAGMLNHSRPRDLKRRYVAKLLEAGLLLEEGEDLYVPEDLEERLSKHLENTGALTAERRQHKRYEQEREVRKNPHVDSTPGLMGPEKVAEIVARQRERDAKRRDEYERSQAGTTARLWLRDRMEGVTGWEWNTLVHDFYTETGWTDKRLKEAVWEEGLRRVRGSDGEWYVYRKEEVVA